MCLLEITCGVSLQSWPPGRMARAAGLRRDFAAFCVTGRVSTASSTAAASTVGSGWAAGTGDAGLGSCSICCQYTLVMISGVALFLKEAD